MSTPAAAPIVPEPKKLTFSDWLILTIASIGFAFDIYELLMLPLVLRPALTEFGIMPGTDEFTMWFGRLFYLPAFFGGVFGLLGGYMTDLLGRRRVLTWSILLYAFSAFAAGFSTGPWMLLVFRTTTFIGVCIEFVAAVAWLAELFPNPLQREKVLGYTQAFSSIGGLLVASANSLAGNLEQAGRLITVQIPTFLTGILGEIAQTNTSTLTWRYTLMSGLIPAIPLLVIRPFLPESPIWAKKQSEGTLKRPSLLALFSPELRRTTVVTMIMFACSYGAAFGAIQQMPQIVPGLTEDVQNYKEKIFKVQQAKLPEADRAKGMDSLPKKDQKSLTTLAEQKLASDYTKVQEIGGLIGRFLLAMIAVYFVSRRNLLRVFQGPGLILMPLIFWFFLQVENTTFFNIPLDFLGIGSLPITVCSLGILIAGLFTVAQFSFWGNYLPTAYPVHLRGTGESFAANIGGRLIGTSFAWVTAQLAVTSFIPGDSPPAKFAAASAIVAGFVYLVGSIACFLLPEPKGDMVD
ncbi:MAG: MFS transporter [Gemmataceae bacterium]|nr:MFS transporter [Gemmataceae bacterium]